MPLPPALVLAAGLGTRLDPLTRLVAKAAVPLGDRTLVEHVLLGLARQGVTETVINLHHLPATVTGIVGDGRHLGVAARYSWEQPVLGSAGGPRRALPLLDADTFFIINGDTLADVNLAHLLEVHQATGADVTLALVPQPAPDRYGGVVLDAEDRVIGVRPRGKAEGTWHFVFAQVVRAAVFADLPDGVPAESIGGIYRPLIEEGRGRIRGVRLNVPFVDVGTPRDYLDAALHFSASGPPPVNPRVDGSARLTRTAVWPGAAIGPGVVLEGCVVAGPVIVPPQFAARDAVLVPSGLAREGDRVDVRDGVAVFPLSRG